MNRWIVSILVLILLVPGWSFAQFIELQQPIKYLAIGDDYTIGANEQPEFSWPRMLIDELEDLGFEFYETNIFANEGWNINDALFNIEDLELENTWNLVSINLGFIDHLSEDLMNEFGIDFVKILDKGIMLAGGDPKDVFVISIPDYGFTPFGLHNIEYISESIALYNTVIQHFVELRGAHFIDITELSQLGLFNSQYLTNDGLHPSRLMYEKWVQLILEKMNTTTSINENYSKARFNIYPNPTSGLVFIDVPGYKNEAIRIDVYNQLGIKLSSLELSNDSGEKLFLEGLPGLYFLQIFDGDEMIQTIRIFKN